jgi:hypothetical protein
VAFITSVLMTPAVAAAQTGGTGAIGGVVKDAIGAVLPGATVEAASPALIEKVRTVTTDAQGNYKIVDLRPGTYSVTFSLTGFSTVKHEGLELTAGFTATVNAQLNIGAVTESVTVSGASPVVDVQNVLSQRVLTPEILTATPTAQNLTGYAALTVGIRAGGQTSNAPDVGGSIGEGNTSLAVHGTRDTDMHVNYDGLSGQNWTQDGGGQGRHLYFNRAYVEEVTLAMGAVGADNETGGVEVNVIPKDGGNTFHGVFNGEGTSGRFQTNNLTDALRAQGLSTKPGIDYIYDVNGGLGGPISRDKLWFYYASRQNQAWLLLGNNFYNLTPNTLFYAPDLSRPARKGITAGDNSWRMTWQVAPKHKINLSYLHDSNCSCYNATAVDRRPDGAYRSQIRVRFGQGGWTAPVTDRLLFEAKANYLWDVIDLRPTEGVSPTAISVFDNSTGYRYGSSFTNLSTTDYGRTLSTAFRTKAAMSYVTGSHAFKVGLTTTSGKFTLDANPTADVAYTFTCARPGCAPVSITEFTRPYNYDERVRLNLGVYGQDQWTLKRLTLNLGLRWDYFNGYTPAYTRSASFYTPAIPTSEVDNTPNWKDISPRLGAAYDLFGNGKTALKVALGRYNVGQGYTVALASNPAAQVVSITTRTWNDLNGNYVPECDLLNPQAHGECGRIANLAFGTRAPNQTYDPALLTGWGVRPANWQTSAILQHELRPGVGLLVGYYRTWYVNFSATDNVAVAPGDFSPYCITVPTDARLPGGGDQLCGFFDIKPSAFGLVQNVLKAGDFSEVYNSVDVTVNARFGKGGLLQGGVGTGALDPISWTSSERWIRCPEWPTRREAGGRAGGLTTTSRPRRSGSYWTRARAWVPSPAISI